MSSLRTRRAATSLALGLAVCLVPVAGSLADTPAVEPARAGVTSSDPVSNPTVHQVLAISVDGLNPDAITRLGAGGAPTLHRLISEGVSTLNARTEFERTETLPNHTGMITGLRIRAAQGGHGVEWNDERRTPRTVQRAAGRSVPSVFSKVRSSGRSTALFASKAKFSLWQRSWPRAFSRFVIKENNAALVRAVREDLARPRAFRFLHLSAPDRVGHASGYMSRAYLDQVRRTDRMLGTLVASVEQRQPGTVVVLTSDHGGLGHRHDTATDPVNYRVPFIVWGPGISAGDLYAINPAYADPGTSRPRYAKPRQPVRNGAVANLSLDLLGLSALAKSEHDRDQNLLVVPALPR